MSNNISFALPEGPIPGQAAGPANAKAPAEGTRNALRRCFGLSVVLALVVVDGVLIRGVEAWGTWMLLAAVMLAYGSVTWSAEALLSSRSAAAILPRAFVLLDLIPLGAAVAASGAGASWLFFVVLLRFDTTTDRRRWEAPIMAHAAVAVFVAIAWMDGSVPWPEVAGRGAILYACAIALALDRCQLLRRSEGHARDMETVGRLLGALQQKNVALKELAKRAGAATKAKDDFLTSVSHELRTPLNAIIGMSELMHGTELDATQREFMGTMRASSHALLSLVNDVLDFQKIEAQEVEVEKLPFDLGACMRDVVDILRHTAAKKGVKLEVSAEEDTPGIVIGDPTRFRQVLLNLMGNAVKFTEQGTVSVHIAPVSSEAGACTLHLAVRDTGIGIPESRLTSLFHSFKQLDASTTRKYGGTGLGLAISKRLTELMGGRMWVESTEGEGSCFHFTVAFSVDGQPEPIVLARPAPPAAKESVAPENQDTSAASASSRAQPRILLAEDNVVNQTVAVRMLARLGHSDPKVVSNGREAVEAVRQKRYDLVLMDLSMPEMDGIAATKEIFALPDARHRPRIIALTANAFESDRRRCFEAGMVGFLSKPIRSEELDRVIKEAWSETHAT